MELNFKLWLEAAFKNSAYWISPIGEIIPNNVSHIDYIYNNPEKFGFTKDQLDEIHAKHGERRGQEGNARDEILIQVMQQGWIRLRKYTRPDVWSVQTINPKNLHRRISDWMWKLINDGHAGLYNDVKISLGDSISYSSFKDYLGKVA